MSYTNSIYSDVLHLQSSQCNYFWSVKVKVHVLLLLLELLFSEFVLLLKYINFVLLPASYTYPLMALKGMVAAVVLDVLSVLTLVL